MDHKRLTAYSIKLYHTKTGKYEYMKEVLAENSGEAIKKFRQETSWVELKDTLLYAQPPICR
tara:strand:+ start:6285 stop:6470 length:186 start_codon:yes stop_codon:yes gene_type:complete